MNDFNQQLFKLGLGEVLGRYINHYFDLHGDILPANGLHPFLVKEIEKPLIEISLKRLKGNQVKVAQLLGINRNTLRRKITELNICLKKEAHDL